MARRFGWEMSRLFSLRSLMGNFGTIHGKGAVARRYIVDDGGYSLDASTHHI
jgi:hypothetical protein